MSGGLTIMATAKKTPAGPTTVAEFIAAQVEMSDKTQREIATAIGYDKPNIITMFKQGLTKIPLNKVTPLARVLGIDPAYLLRIVMREYQPEMWDAIQESLGGAIATEWEKEMLDEIRDVTKNTNPRMDSPRRSELRKWARTLMT